MSNRDRIKDWRVRRSDRSAGDDAQHGAAEEDVSPGRSGWSSSKGAEAVLESVLDSLVSASRESVAGRRRTYDALERDLETDLQRQGAAPELLEFRQRQLRLVI